MAAMGIRTHVKAITATVLILAIAFHFLPISQKEAPTDKYYVADWSHLYYLWEPIKWQWPDADSAHVYLMPNRLGSPLHMLIVRTEDFNIVAVEPLPEDLTLYVLDELKPKHSVSIQVVVVLRSVRHERSSRRI